MASFYFLNTHTSQPLKKNILIFNPTFKILKQNRNNRQFAKYHKFMEIFKFYIFQNAIFSKSLKVQTGPLKIHICVFRIVFIELFNLKTEFILAIFFISYFLEIFEGEGTKILN